MVADVYDLDQRDRGRQTRVKVICASRALDPELLQGENEPGQRRFVQRNSLPTKLIIVIRRRRGIH